MGYRIAQTSRVVPRVSRNRIEWFAGLDKEFCVWVGDAFNI